MLSDAINPSKHNILNRVSFNSLDVLKYIFKIIEHNVNNEIQNKTTTIMDRS